MILTLLVSAFAGQLDGQVSVDLFSATSRAQGAGVGPSETLSAHELGLGLRLNLREVEDRLRVKIDYRGREPIAGRFRNNTRRVLYAAEVNFQVVPKKLTLGLGRFTAPTPTFLLVDGGRIQYDTPLLTVGVFGGRRGVSSSFKNLGLTDFLPAFGGWMQLHADKAQVNVNLAYQEDRVLVALNSRQESLSDDVGGLTAQARVTVQPSKEVAVGGQVSFVQAATYRVGPTWSEADVQADAFGLFNAWGWANIQPTPWLRAELDGGHQRVQAFRLGTVDGTGATTDDVVQRPRFTDARLGLRIGPPSMGWLRPTVRYRTRPSGLGPSEGARTELRAGLQLDIHDFGIKGPYLTASASMENDGGNAKDDIGFFDKTMGRAAAGFRKGGFDASLGASYVERAAVPVSGRRFSVSNPGIPDSSEDLQPFTLEADPILFGRVFYSGRHFFGGADLEKSLTEAEFRVFLQVGVLTGVGW